MDGEFDQYEEKLELEYADLLFHKNCRLQIPAEDRNRYDLTECWVDAIVGKGDHSIPLTDAWVNEKGKLGVPANKRRLYGIETGDRLDLRIEGVIKRE